MHIQTTSNKQSYLPTLPRIRRNPAEYLSDACQTPAESLFDACLRAPPGKSSLRVRKNSFNSRSPPAYNSAAYSSTLPPGGPEIAM